MPTKVIEPPVMEKPDFPKEIRFSIPPELHEVFLAEFRITFIPGNGVMLASRRLLEAISKPEFLEAYDVAVNVSKKTTTVAGSVNPG